MAIEGASGKEVLDDSLDAGIIPGRVPVPSSEPIIIIRSSAGNCVLAALPNVADTLEGGGRIGVNCGRCALETTLSASELGFSIDLTPIQADPRTYPCEIGQPLTR